jgi:hypothetical protein
MDKVFVIARNWEIEFFHAAKVSYVGGEEYSTKKKLGSSNHNYV